MPTCAEPATRVEVLARGVPLMAECGRIAYPGMAPSRRVRILEEVEKNLGVCPGLVIEQNEGSL